MNQTPATNYTDVIYILTNPAFKEYVKIGYTDNLAERLSNLNRKSAVPFAFRVYAVYEVPTQRTDTRIHAIIDQLNPSLRSREEIDGKSREREFFAMTPEEAYSLLENIAAIHGRTDKLHLIAPTADELRDERAANDINEEYVKRTARIANFSFSACGIQPGETIEYVNDNAVIAKVLDDHQVEYEGKAYSLSALAKKLLGVEYSVAGPRYFTYKGELLNLLNERHEQINSQGNIDSAKTL